MRSDCSWASARTLLVTAGSFVLCRGVYANPLQQRADTTSSSTPSQSLDSATILSGTLHSTPTASATATAAASNADLVTATLTSATNTASSAATGGVSAPSVPDDSFPKCTDADVGDFPPFCLPTNGSDKYPGDNYYVTWSPDLLPENSTVTVLLNYVNTTGGTNAWTSPKTPNAYGYVIVTMDKTWLQSSSRNNLTFYLNALDASNTQLTPKPGPVISLTNPPIIHYPAPTHSPPNRLGMELGIPIGIAFFLFILLGLFLGMRKHRHINLKMPARRRKGYGIGKSRRQRMGQTGGVRLGDIDASRGDQYQDEPVELQQRNAGHTREESLGSLVNSPTAEDFEDRRIPHSNHFRDEIARQMRGR